MTTIAFRDGTMAADSQVTYHGRKVNDFAKLWWEQGWLAGFAGDTLHMHAVQMWLCDRLHQSRDPRRWAEHCKLIHEDTRVLIATPDGAIWKLNAKSILRVPGTYYSYGSGSDYAMGAMAMGASAEAAVKIAAEFDPHTGGRVFTESLPQGHRHLVAA